jgi:hypothetical protein
MASGDTLFILTPQMNEAPASNPATFDTRNNHLVLDFDAATDEEAVFPIVMPRNYSATTGITLTIAWMATTATTGNVVWQAGIERHEDDAVDLDSDSFAALNGSGASATASVSGEVQYTTITFTDGADMDSLAAGESGRLKLRRDADDTSATDSMSGDAELLRIEVQDT